VRDRRRHLVCDICIPTRNERGRRSKSPRPDPHCNPIPAHGPLVHRSTLGKGTSNVALLHLARTTANRLVGRLRPRLTRSTFIPPEERHATWWLQGPILVSSTNFTSSGIALGFAGPSLGLSVAWPSSRVTRLWSFRRLFLHFHGSRARTLACPQMIQARTQFRLPRSSCRTLAVIITPAERSTCCRHLVLQTGLQAIWGEHDDFRRDLRSVAAAALAIFDTTGSIAHSGSCSVRDKTTCFTAAVPRILFGAGPHAWRQAARSAQPRSWAVFVISAGLQHPPGPYVSTTPAYLGPAKPKNSYYITTIRGRQPVRPGLMAWGRGSLHARRHRRTPCALITNPATTWSPTGFAAILAVFVRTEPDRRGRHHNPYWRPTLGVGHDGRRIVPRQAHRPPAHHIICVALLVLWSPITLRQRQNVTTFDQRQFRDPGGL